jgi:AraC-like DNA-binding protein
MACIRPPLPALRPYVESVWAGEGTGDAVATGREHALPSGQMHLAVRLDGTAVRLFDGEDDAIGRVVGSAVVAGARAGYYIKETPGRTRTVGVQLRPGAAEALLGVSAAALSGRHVALDTLWGTDAQRLCERLTDTPDTDRRLMLLQAALLSRLRPLRGLHPEIAQALTQVAASSGVSALVDASGTSHRRFIALFRDATGLSPKRYARVLRFRRLVEAFNADPTRSWIDLALATGYSDQSHCIREFREFAGVTPQAYRRSASTETLHLPVAAPR